MADVRHANYDGLKSCARVKQQVTGTRSERLPPPGSMSSSPASLDVDVNSLSTTSSTASSCLPLVPVSCGGSGRAPVSGKKGAAPCGQSRGTSNDIVRSSSAAVSGPDSIITYIDCNSGSQLHRHQPFCSSSQEEAHDGDDEGEDEVTQTSPNSASCLQVRRGSEPVLNAVHRFEADEDLLTANCDNSKRWSTAIAVDSSGRKGCCTQSKRSTESLAEDLLVDHSDEGMDEAKGSSISPRSAKEEGYGSEEKSSDPSANTPSSTTSNLTFSRFQRDSGRQSMLANNIGSWVEAADRQLIRMKNEANCKQSNHHSDESQTESQQQQKSSPHEQQEQRDRRAEAGDRNQATSISAKSHSSSDSSSSSTSASSSPAPPLHPAHDASDNHSNSKTSSNLKHEQHRMRNEMEKQIDASSRSERKGDSCPDFDDEDEEDEGEDEDDPTDTHDSSHHVRQESLDQSDKRTFVRAVPSPPVILSVRAGAGPLGIHVVPYSDPNRGGYSNGMLIEKIEPGGRIDADGRFDIDDWIIEVNGESLLRCDFKEAEEIFKEALKLSPEVNLKVIKKRSLSNGSMQTTATTAATPSSSSLSAACVTTNSASSTSAMNQCSKKCLPPSVMPKPSPSKVMAAESAAASGLIEIEERSSRRVAAKSATITSTKKVTASAPSAASSATTTAATAACTPAKATGKSPVKGSITPAVPAATTSSGGAAGVLVAANTRKIGKKYHIRLQKRVNGLGFSITTRDNPAGGNCPIYIKNILPKGSAIFDGRLKQGDRLLEVNGVEMTGKSQEEAVQLLKAITVSTQVDMIVSRQEPFPLDPLPSPKVPRQIPPEKAGDVPTGPEKQREVLTFEIPLNDTGSAGLGVSVKGKTCTSAEGETADLGIFVKNVIHGGAASKDGRLKQNDQLISINGVHLLGLSNAEAMETLRRGMVSPDIGPDATPGVIKLTITRRVSASSVLHQRDLESSGECEEEKSCEDDDYGDDDDNCCYNEEEVFTRDGFGRQSMSEKRHAHLDAKNTDTYQKTKKVREGKQQSRSSSLEKGTPGRSSLGHRRVKSSVTTPKDLLQDLTTPKENKSIAALADTPSRAKALFSPACCWSCQSPGSCSCRSHLAAKSQQPQTQTQSRQQPQGRTAETPVRTRSRSTGPTTSGTGIRKSSSLENLESMMQDLQKLHLEASGGMRPATMRVSRSRAKNESFRAAVDRSYDAPRNMLADQEGDMMETVDEGSESGSSVGQHQQHNQLLQKHQLNQRTGYEMHGAGGLNMGCFSGSSQRPSGTGISLASQTTGFSTITGTTTTTATSAGTSTDDDLALIRGRNQRSDEKERDGGKDAAGKQKRGILNKLFKFGSKKDKKGSHTSHNLLDQETDAEQVHARRQALSEQGRIQEHVRRMKEQQDLLIRHQQLQHQISQQSQQSQQLTPDSLPDDGDKYGHYMNHHQIQEQMRNLGVPVAYSNRPMPRRSNPQPPPPLPPGRPQLHSSVRLRANVSSPTTVIDARGVAISRERPLSNYFEYDSSSVLPPNPSAMNPNAIYEQRLIHQQLMQQQQQQEAAQRTAQLRQQMLKQQLHEAALYQQQGPSAAAMARLQSDVYGVISADHRTDPNLFRRQLSNHRIVPATQPIATRVRQPVYQDQNVYVYSNPPTGYSEHPVYGTRAAAVGATGVPQLASAASIYGSYYGPSKPPPPLHPSHHSLQHLQQKLHHQGQSFYGPVSHHVNSVTGSNV